MTSCEPTVEKSSAIVSAATVRDERSAAGFCVVTFHAGRAEHDRLRIQPLPLERRRDLVVVDEPQAASLSDSSTPNVPRSENTRWFSSPYACEHDSTASRPPFTNASSSMRPVQTQTQSVSERSPRAPRTPTPGDPQKRRGWWR